MTDMQLEIRAVVGVRESIVQQASWFGDLVGIAAG